MQSPQHLAAPSAHTVSISSAAASAAADNLLLDPAVWGPHYWFFLHTVAMTYPRSPNEVTRKKYYELIQNMPLFLPVDAVSKQFGQILEQYPVSAYLDSRESLIRWVHFVHNQINGLLKKEPITLDEFYLRYYDAYKPVDLKMRDHQRWKEQMWFTLLVSLLGLGTLWAWRRSSSE